MKPITRLEHFLAKIAGDKDAKNLNPITRKEYYLNEIAENGDGSAAFVVTITLHDGNTYTSDKTPEEIFEAYMSGKNIIAYFEGYYLSCAGISAETNPVSIDWIRFGAYTPNTQTGTLEAGYGIEYSNKTWSVIEL